MWQIFKLLSKLFLGSYKSRQFYNRIILIGASILLGVISGLALNKLSHLIIQDIDRLKVYILTGLLILPFMRIILPAYKPLRMIVPDYYPVSGFNKLIINLIIDILSDFFVFLIIFLLMITLIYRELSIEFLVQGYLLIITSHLLRRIMQNLIEYKYNIKSFLFVAVTFSILLAIFFLKNPCEPSNLIWAIILFGLTFFINFLTEGLLPVQIKSGVSTIRLPVKNIFWHLLLYNRSVRVSLIIAVALKIILLTSDLFFLRKTGRHILDGNLLYWVFFVAPTFYFSYVFNNLWGYYRSLWLQLKIHFDNDWIEYFNIFFRIIVKPLMIDIIITIIFLLVLWDIKLFALSYYFLSLIFLCCFSIYWSFECPAYMTESSIFKIAHSPKGNFFCFLATGVLYLLKINPWLYLLVPVYLLVSVLLLIRVKNNILGNRWDVYKPLFS